jgi:biotin carboxyl carrier protein
MRDLHESTESHHFRRNAGIMDDIGKTHQLQLESGCFETRLTKKYAHRKPYEKHDPRIITAFIPGSIAEVDARVGMRVRQGDTLLILEAMKMRNKLKSPMDGTVKAVNVATGDKVMKGQVLVELE